MVDLMIEIATGGTAPCCIALIGVASGATKISTARLNKVGKSEQSRDWFTALCSSLTPGRGGLSDEGTDELDLCVHRRIP